MIHTKRILLCINAHPKTYLLLRNAASKSKETGLEWTVLYIETPDHYAGDDESRERLLRYLALAKEMGADIQNIVSPRVAETIVTFIKDAALNGTEYSYVIMGQTSKEGFFAELKASLAERVAHALRGLNTEVQIIPLSGKNYTPTWFERLQLREIDLKGVIFALFSVSCAYFAAELLHINISSVERQIQVHNVMAFFLIACVITALRHGLIAGLISAITSFAVLNYFYSTKLYNLNLSYSADGLSLTIFLFSSVIISLSGAYSRASNAALIRKEKRSQALYKLHRIVNQAADQNTALKVLHQELQSFLQMEVAFFMPPIMKPDTVELVYPKDIELSEKDVHSLQRCWTEARSTGFGTFHRFDSSWRFEPLISPKWQLGVLGVKITKDLRLDASIGRLIAALADQIASILESLELTRMIGDSRIREEREKLRSMLLSSVSHDLKTPLASIIGSLSVFKRMRKSGRLDMNIADELIETALDEAQRLDSFITNILEMTRIESGDITFNLEWSDPYHILQRIEKRMRQRLQNHTLITQKPDIQIEIEMDVLMTEQVLQNVIENAVKYSPVGTEITVTYGKSPDSSGCAFYVRDQGEGIPEDKLETIFDKYERLKQSDSQIAGTGLGLAISRALMEKQGGSIIARNHDQGGAEFILSFTRCRTKREKESAEKRRVTV